MSGCGFRGEKREKTNEENAILVGELHQDGDFIALSERVKKGRESREKRKRAP
jgi:hypothetical protein